MTTKLFEVRDSMTFIPIMATRMNSTEEAERYLLGRSGYLQGSSIVLMTRLADNQTEYDPISWPKIRGRTMAVAHAYLEHYFDTLESGAVIDVEHLLGERATPKVSERIETAIYD